MKKEVVKTTLLIFLIISSIFLTKELWLDEKLWSSDYNFFSNFEKNSIIKQIGEKIPWLTSDAPIYGVFKKQIFYPKKIVINFSDFREVLYSESKEYKIFLDECENILKNISTEEKEIKKSTVLKEEWLNALKSKSVLIDYNINVETDMFENILGLESNRLKQFSETINEILVLPDTGVLKTFIIYIKGNDDNIIKLGIENIDSRLSELLEKYIDEKSVRYTYSFERGFDEKRVNKIVIDSEVLIPRNKINIDSISISRSLQNNSEEYIADMLKAFEYGSTVYRQHTEIDNTKVYAKNFSTLKINADDGYIEYRAIEADRGIRLSSTDKEKYEKYESLEMAVNFLGKIDLLDESLKITSDLVSTETENLVYRFTFDCYYNGIPVIIKSEKYGCIHKAEIEVSNGYISYFKACTNKYSKEKSIETQRNILEALDMLYKQIGEKNEEIAVKEIFIGYVIEDSKEIYMPQWVFQIYDNKVYTVPAVE